MNPSENALQELLNRVVDDELRDDDFGPLNEQIRSSAETQAHYLDLLLLDELLRVEFPLGGSADKATPGLWETVASQSADATTTADQGLSPVGRTARAISFRRHPRRMVIASLVTVALFWTFWAYQIRLGQDDLLNRPQAGDTTVVATLQTTSDCQWTSPEKSAAPGDQLRAGRLLQLAHGIAEFEFASGAKVVVQGPTEWTIDSNNAATLMNGKLVARVPKQAVGFTVATPSATIVDLGTEFGVEVTGAGDTNIHVLQGRVEARAVASGPAIQPIRLKAGEAIHVAPHEVRVSRFEANRGAFSFAPPIAMATTREPLKLLGFYPFDGNAEDASPNKHHATRVANIEYAIGFEGEAAHFEGNAKSVIELPIDASATACPDLTIGAWARPAVDNKALTILSTDNGPGDRVVYDRILMIDDRRGLKYHDAFTFVAFAGPKVGVFASTGPPPVVNRWTFVAAVYRQAQKLLVLYVEDPQLRGGKGGLVSDIASNVEIGPSDNLIRVGRLPDNRYPGAFHGDLDNLFVIRGALAHDQLEAIRTGGAARILETTTKFANQVSR